MVKFPPYETEGSLSFCNLTTEISNRSDSMLRVGCEVGEDVAGGGLMRYFTMRSIICEGRGGEVRMAWQCLSSSTQQQRRDVSLS